MKRMALPILILLVSATVSFGQAKYLTYHNQRFGYSIEYPSDVLKMEPPPANDDGRNFVSKDLLVEMMVYAHYNAEEVTWKQQYERDLSDLNEKPSYAVFKDDWYVLSGSTGNGRIFYQKSLRRKTGNTEVFCTFTIAYPESQRAKFDPIVKRVSASFKFDPKARV